MTTIRLLMPQWQGGNNPNYAFGSELLAWLAPKSKTTKEIRVPINEQADLQLEEGIIGRQAVTGQLMAAKEILANEKPERVIVLGGDCLVEQAPIDYLNGLYENLGVLWIDAHPDTSFPETMSHSHAMVLANLLGDGDKKLASKVEYPLKRAQVAFVGLNNPADYEAEYVAQDGLTDIRHETIEKTIAATNKWIKDNSFKHVMIHFDVDALNPTYFHSTLLANPYGEPIDAPKGVMHLHEVVDLAKAVSKATDVVGFGITEHLPWDMIRLRELLSQIPIFKDEDN